MSRATGVCRFSDGTIKFFLYDGTVGFVRPNLYDTIGEAWNQRPNVIHLRTERKPEEAVTLAVDCGNGMHWQATAERGVMRVTSRLDPYEIEEGELSGAYFREPSICHTPDKGLPDWARVAIYGK